MQVQETQSRTLVHMQSKICYRSLERVCKCMKRSIQHMASNSCASGLREDLQKIPSWKRREKSAGCDETLGPEGHMDMEIPQKSHENPMKFSTNGMLQIFRWVALFANEVVGAMQLLGVIMGAWALDLFRFQKKVHVRCAMVLPNWNLFCYKLDTVQLVLLSQN